MSFLGYLGLHESWEYEDYPPRYAGFVQADDADGFTDGEEIPYDD